MHVGIVERSLDARPIDFERRTRNAHLRQLDFALADPEPLFQPQLVPVDPSRREVLSQRAGEQRKALGDELVDPFDGDQEKRLAPPAERLTWTIVPLTPASRAE